MAPGRSVAGLMSAVWVAIICLFLLPHLQITESKEFIVGDNGGWGFQVSNWPNNKTFHAGDVLVFRYNPSIHNVVAVDAKGYNDCTPGSDAKVYRSGNDRITLKIGDNYFFCSIPQHCESFGMKIAVHAT